jgi:hypothetical protein
MVFVKANGEPLDQQVPYIVAFAMFGVVGALIVSRDRRNTIGILFLWASFVTASSFLCGELFTYAVVHGQSGWCTVEDPEWDHNRWLWGLRASELPPNHPLHAVAAKHPFGLSKIVVKLAATARNLEFLSCGSGFCGVAETHRVFARLGDLHLPGQSTAPFQAKLSPPRFFIPGPAACRLRRRPAPPGC